MTDSLGSIALRVFDIVQDVPSDVSGNMPGIAWLALQHVNNYLRETTGSNSIGDNRQGVLTNLTAAMALGRMQNVDLDFNWTLGAWSVQKGQGSSANSQMNFLLGLVNQELKMAPHGRSLFSKANG